MLDLSPAVLQILYRPLVKWPPHAVRVLSDSAGLQTHCTIYDVGPIGRLAQWVLHLPSSEVCLVVRTGAPSNVLIFHHTTPFQYMSKSLVQDHGLNTGWTWCSVKSLETKKMVKTGTKPLS